MEPHARSLPNVLCMLLMPVAWSSSSVIASRCVLPVLWMTSFISLMGRYEGAILLKFTYLHKVGQNFNFVFLKGIIWTNYFEITHKLK